jgi:putative ABC transport system ATP-binding protein
MNVAASPEIVLKLDSLAKTFPAPEGDFEVFRELSLEARRGEVSVINGPSGSGKTTLLQIAGLLLRANRGEVGLCGVLLNGVPESKRVIARRNHIGFVFQQFHLLASLTVYENIAFGLRLKRQPEDRGRIFGIMELLGIESQADKRPRLLSGGQKQRVAIARALIGRPELLLADEPTSQLDSNSAEATCQLIRKAADQTGVAAIVATHDPRVDLIGDRKLHLKNGRLE